MKLAPLFFAFVVVAGCGGKAFVEDGDAGDGGSKTDGFVGDDIAPDSGNCPPPPSGCQFVSANECQLDCNTCRCNGTEWACTALGCVDASPPVCPTNPPPFGSYCSSNGEMCTFGPGCGPQCTCENNAWRCVYPPCPPPVCPSQPPTGSCVGEVGMICSYGSGCNQTQCDCVSTSNGPVWECLGTGCADAGTIEAGH